MYRSRVSGFNGFANEHATRFTNFHEELLSRQTRMRDRYIGTDLYPEAGYHSRKADDEQVAHLHEVAKEVIEGLE